METEINPSAVNAHLRERPADHYVTVDGCAIRYFERGRGAPVLFMHGASLGSSSDVFLRNLDAFAAAGMRAIAFDFPGFGLSTAPAVQSYAQQRDSVPKLIDALELGRVALVAHSRSGATAVQLALREPQRYSCIVILGTGALLPALPGDVEGRYDAVARRVDRQMAEAEPTLAETRKMMEADIFHTELITAAEVALRNSRSTGRAFAYHVARMSAGEGGVSAEQIPLWQRMLELKLPLLLIYGKNDRAHALERALMLKELHPALNLHLVDNCKHMVHWDAQAEVERLAIPFIREHQK
ncbi:MAG TPA: alpha/beta fold hydrolase [Candidatus Binataceae bacterium]|nr:alpha/beta fold hydrolase [Candidatus Binataceae bacterium]